jgi:hypothetical protein
MERSVSSGSTLLPLAGSDVIGFPLNHLGAEAPGIAAHNKTFFQVLTPFSRVR